MTTEEFKEITRAVVVALRKELTLDNKDILTKLDEVENKLVYDGRELEVGISVAPGNNLSKRTDGLYARNNYVTTESSPVGEIIAFMGTQAPEHYLFCDGTTYNIGDYPVLEAFFKEQFGSVNHFGGDGTTTFAVPDLRGEFLRGTGDNIHSDQGSGSNVGEHQNATLVSGAIGGGSETGSSMYLFSAGSWTTPSNFDVGINQIAEVPINAEKKNTHRIVGGTVRPTNTSVMYCIKYESTSVDEIRFLVTRPDLWPLGEEVDLGNGLYGIRMTGTITAAAGEAVNEHIIYGGKYIVSFGGWFVVNSISNDKHGIGQTVQNSKDSSLVCASCVYYKVDEDVCNLYTVSTVDRTDAEYECWVIYTK